MLLNLGIFYNNVVMRIEILYFNDIDFLEFEYKIIDDEKSVLFSIGNC